MGNYWILMFLMSNANILSERRPLNLEANSVEILIKIINDQNKPLHI